MIERSHSGLPQWDLLNFIDFCYNNYACDLGLVHLHKRLNGLFRRDRPADKLCR
jgi:hypothetical protein